LAGLAALAVKNKYLKTLVGNYCEWRLILTEPMIGVYKGGTQLTKM